LLAAVGLLATASPGWAKRGGTSGAKLAHPARFLVGFAKEDITPTQLPFDYLGGEGYQRVGTTVVSPLYVRTLAIAAADRHGRPTGPPVVISAIDAQGWFSGYQAGTGGTGVADY